MVATLVLILPYPHIGGNLVINHKKSKYSVISENLDAQDIKYAAFYADCEHEIKKVKQGYRVALTFNVVLENNKLKNNEHINKKLENALQGYFQQANKQENSKPKILTYLLDHEYTEHSLRWNMLKGADAKNSSSFLSATKNLGLSTNLALIEFKQTWSTEPSYDYYSSESSSDAEPEDLIDENQHLYSWIDINNNKLAYRNYNIDSDSLCMKEELDYLKASETEHEGYMGNYGHTIDYWYKKAAIVVWQKDDDLLMKFNLNYQEEIDNLVKLAKVPKNELRIKEIINQVKKIYT